MHPGQEAWWMHSSDQFAQTKLSHWQCHCSYIPGSPKQGPQSKVFWLQFPSGHCLKARYLNLLVKCYWMQLNEVSSHPEVLWTHKNLNLAQNILFLCIFFSNSAYLHFAQIYSAKPLSTDFQRGQLFNLYTMQKFKLNQFGRYFPFWNSRIPKETCRQ